MHTAVMDAPAETLTEQQIRRDERARVAQLLVDNTDLLARFATDKKSLVGLIALMVDLGE